MKEKKKLPVRLQIGQRGEPQHFSIMKAATSKISTHEKHYCTNIVRCNTIYMWPGQKKKKKSKVKRQTRLSKIIPVLYFRVR